jgi:hypothetical protein
MTPVPEKEGSDVVCQSFRSEALSRTRLFLAVSCKVPRDQLLLHSAVDGYAPLAAFLGRAPPQDPYPKVRRLAQKKKKKKEKAVASHAFVGRISCASQKNR